MKAIKLWMVGAFALLVSAAVSDLIADNVAASQFSAAAAETSDADLRALAEIYEAYDAALKARGWRDPHDAPVQRLHLRPLGGGQAVDIRVDLSFHVHPARPPFTRMRSAPP